MTRIIIVIAALTSGCVGEAMAVCPSQHFAQVAFDGAMDCANYQSNEALAFSMLADAGIQTDTHGWNVVVRDRQFLNTVESDCIGWTDVTSETITLATEHAALLHEIIHVWQWRNGTLDTMTHPGWCENGYGDENCQGSLDAEFHATLFAAEYPNH